MKKNRPELHFTPEKNWMNDPNGLSYYKGNYHMFYQHNPKNLYWGNMTWGHATSKDLFNWEYKPYALIPDRPEDIDGCFSGSALVEGDTLFLAYTGIVMTEKKINEYGNPVTATDDSMISTQLFAKSDDGINFQKLAEPKILAPEGYCTAHFRDPKIWKKNGNYYMVLGAKKDSKGRVLLYRSTDLKNWEFVNEIFEENMGFMWECPDLFELDGKEVLIFSPQGIGMEGQEHISGYYIGKLDYQSGKYIHNDFTKLDSGFEFYAPQTFLDEKNRRILIGWLVNHKPYPDEEWSGVMTIPRELRIKNDRLYSYPIEEINSFRRSKKNINDIKEEGEIVATSKVYDLELTVESLNNFEIILGDINKKGLRINYNSKDKILYLDRSEAINGFSALETFGTTREIKVDLKEKSDIRIIRDKNIIEVYINKGEKVLTSLVNLKEEQNLINLKGKFENIVIYNLERG